MFSGLFLCVCLLSYHPGDPSLNQAVAEGYAIRNLAGVIGSFTAGLLVDVFGLGALSLPLVCFHLGLTSFRHGLVMPWWRGVGILLLIVTLTTWAASPWSLDRLSVSGITGGGLFGHELFRWSSFLFSTVGAGVVWGFILLAALQLILGFSWILTGQEFGSGLAGLFGRRRDDDIPALRDLPAPGQGGGGPGAQGAQGAKILSFERKRPRREEPRPERIVDLVEPIPEEPAVEATAPGPSPEPRAKGAASAGEPVQAPDVAAAPRPLLAAGTLTAGLPDPEEPTGAPSDEQADSLAEPPAVPAAPERKAGRLSMLTRLLGRKAAPAPAASEPAAPAAMEDLSFGDLFRPQADAQEAGQGQPPAAREPAWFAEPEPAEFAEPDAPPALPAAPPPDLAAPLPSLDLLAPPPASNAGPDMARLEERAGALVSTLADFGVHGEVMRIVPGPVVNMFEYKPAPGVKLARITGLSNDLAMALKALAVRIEAIPGKDLVGIEIPNEDRQVVSFREVLESPAFQDSASCLTLALGKDIQGQPFAADLQRMPHLLVAGATGAGKSVCLNGILLSMLYKASPAQVRLLLIDPKRIELSMYGALPHLVHPVVTEMAMAKTALEWAVAEMERRYEAMARLTVRNIDGYNDKLASPEVRGNLLLTDLVDQGPMPFLVIIIDELADLMMTAAKEAELAIVRLAQLARAAGIHLILATQRPSVDVVTGLIKANFPTRIAFQVTSKHDSRTILDTVGAEHLLGRGDMLFKPSGGRFKRLHGAYVSEAEIERVVGFWKAKTPQRFDLDFSAWQRGQEEETGEGGEGGLLDDPLYAEALEFVVGQGKASISLIQRRFKIGFNRAARMVEQMEMDGLLGPADGAKPRTVVKGRE